MQMFTQVASSLVGAIALAGAASLPSAAQVPSDQPRPLAGTRPSREAIAAWQARRFGMFIHFGLYSLAGGEWNGQRIDNGYSEQIMANAPVAKADYERLARRFNPVKFDPDGMVALAKAAGMKFIVLTAKHHDGFNLFATKATSYNSVDGTPYGRDLVRLMAEACRRGGLSFGVYYSTIDWHQPQGNVYQEGNSNPITPAQEAFNLVQLKELAGGYGPLSEIWFDMGKPTPAQSARFASAVHALQPDLMVSGRVWNHEGDFTVMSDNALPRSEVEEPWQAPASIYGETWGFRSWQLRADVPAKVAEHVENLVRVVSAGGNYILNIGPMGDGSVVPFEADVLAGIGAWMKDKAEAIYGTTRQPFDELAFGYASLGRDRLYLFVKDVPANGRLMLPGVMGEPFGAAQVLGAPDRHVRVVRDEAGTWVDALALRRGDQKLMPIVAVDLRSPLRVRADTALADPGGGVRLLYGSAARFQNYNGYGYEEPAKTYKLRWYVGLPQGRYAATLNFAAPAPSAGSIELIVDGVHHHVRIVRGSTRTSVAVARGADGEGEPMKVEVTPREPFTKADALPVKIRDLELKPLS